MDPADTDSVRAALAQQGAWLGQQDSQLSSTSREVERLIARVTDLNTQVERMRRESTEARPHSDPEPHVTNPPTYDGDPNSCRPFLSQCSIIFALQPRKYATEESRVAYVITLLCGRAREWATAVWDAQAPFCQSFDDFRVEMLKLFDRSAQGEAAAAHLVRLTQANRSVTDYSIQFQTLAAACGWNEAALRAQFLEGLRDEIQDEIATHDLPRSLDDLIELALRVENRLSYRRHRRSLRHRVLQEDSTASTTPSSPATTPVPEPMQLGRMKLSPKERERRLVNGLCLYCGNAGHQAKNCPVKANAHQ